MHCGWTIFTRVQGWKCNNKFSSVYHFHVLHSDDLCVQKPLQRGGEKPTTTFGRASKENSLALRGVNVEHGDCLQVWRCMMMDRDGRKRRKTQALDQVDPKVEMHNKSRNTICIKQKGVFICNSSKKLLSLDLHFRVDGETRSIIMQYEVRAIS